MVLLIFLIYIASFMVGYGSVSFLVFAEILPRETRTVAYPLGIAIWFVIKFILGTSYETMLEQMGYCGILWMFACISALACIFITIGLPETKGKLPLEIAAFYKAKKSRS